MGDGAAASASAFSSRARCFKNRMNMADGTYEAGRREVFRQPVWSAQPEFRFVLGIERSGFTA